VLRDAHDDLLTLRGSDCGDFTVGVHEAMDAGRGDHDWEGSVLGVGGIFEEGQTGAMFLRSEPASNRSMNITMQDE
jgi:hypothetical protein